MWPKKSTYWKEDNKLMVSIPFTWELPIVYETARLANGWYDGVIVGGPAVELMSGFFDNLDNVKEGHNYPGILQLVNPLATRTTTGCVRKCGFCAIGTGMIEGKFKQLSDWPDLPMISDNNLLASTNDHFDKVINRLISHGWADFNQGIDSRLLTSYHAAKFKKIKKPTIRLALDHMDYRDRWKDAFDCLRDAGIAKRNISSYCLIGFESNKKESWQRCEWVESHGVKAYPMWFHALDQLKKNIVTDDQTKLGWDEESRKHIMGYYYKHRGNVPEFITKN